jgi:ABC-type multidrug transport system ATPase subunit
MTTRDALTARAVSKTFGSFTAVDDMSLDVAPGEIVGLLGANGAGKTTLIKMLLGLLTPTSGTISMFGEPLGRRQRRRVGYVPQNLGLYADLTAAENLHFRAAAFGVSTPDADQDDEYGSLIADHPLGLQRRTAFRAATQHRPEVLILDEPTSGVSPLSRSRLWDLIHQQADDGVGVLVSTHYMDEAEQTDRLVIMSRGRLVAAGTANEVIGARTTVEVSADRWADAFETLDRPGRLLRLAGRRVRVRGQSRDCVLAELEEAGIAAEAEVVAATLEEVLIELDTTGSQTPA